MSTKPKHTAEPWHTQGWMICGSNGMIVADTDCQESELSDDEKDANQHRIMACVNACAGVKDPAKLIEFATRVLMQLEFESEWSSDTVDEIARFAFDEGLAVLGRDGEFEINRKEVML